VNAYDVMHEWGNATGRGSRSDEELDRDIPALLADADYEGWKARLEARDINAIREGMKIWGLPMEPLRPFEIDDAIETAERPYSPD
jgi:hypothetical protein